MKLVDTGRMTRKHFNWLALHVAPMLSTPQDIEDMADDLMYSNDRFDRQKFVNVAVQAWEGRNIGQFEE